GARHVRALLSHGLRRQGRNLRGRLHGRHSLEQRGAIACSTDQSRDGWRQGALCSDQEETMMRAAQTLAICALVTIATGARAQEIDWKKVDEVLGRSAAVSSDVHRYGFGRSDLHVTLDGVAIKVPFALGGWVAFKPAHGGAMIMGDLVLLESEINPVM